MARQPRVVIAERPTHRDHLHGAWWPYSTEIDVELGPLLEVVGARFRTVHGVMLNRDEWATGSPYWQPASAGQATLTWHTLPEPHLAILHCRERCSISILVLPPGTPEDVALTATLMTVKPGNGLTTSQTLEQAQARAAVSRR